MIATEHESRCLFLVFRGEIPRKAELVIRLRGRGSRFVLHSIFLGKSAIKSDIDIVLSHEAPDTYGRIHFRSAMFDASRLDFKGLIRIEKGASGADSYLEARSLLLSPKSMAHIFPYLEIEANDVKASHGASVGRLAEKDLFYLQSRGLSATEAQKILLEGYFQNVFDQLPQEISKRLRNELAR